MDQEKMRKKKKRRRRSDGELLLDGFFEVFYSLDPKPMKIIE